MNFNQLYEQTGSSSGVAQVMELLVYLQTLDTRDLDVLSVSVNQQPARFALGTKHSFKGTPLDVTLPFDLSR